MKIRIFYSLLLITLIHSQNDYKEKMVWRAIDNLYNYKFEIALSTLDSILFLDSSKPVVPFLKIAVKWMDSQINEGHEASYKVIYNEVDKTIPIYESLVLNNQIKSKAYLYFGCTYGIRARVNLARKEWVDVLYTSYLGYKKIKKAESIDPLLIDVNMPIGLLEYFSGISPLPIRIVAELFGINPNKNQGIIKLKKAVNAKSYSWVEAAISLTYIWLYFENNLKEGELLAFKLMNKFPENPIFPLLYGESILRQGKINEYEKVFQKYQNNNVTFPEYLMNECELKIRYLNSLIDFQSNNLNSALINIEWIEKNYYMEMDWLLGLSWLLKGKIFDLQNKRGDAVYYYNKTANLNNYFKYINWAKLYTDNAYLGIDDDPYFELFSY